MKRNQGFTLVEIMVVVAIMAVLIALTVPNMLRSRMTANEVAAIAGCRTISNACQAYYANHLPHKYPPTGLSELIVPESDPPYIDNVLAQAIDEDHAKQGYYYIYTPVDDEHFSLKANPKVYGRTGGRYFYIDETGVIKANPTQEAGPDDTAIP